MNNLLNDLLLDYGGGRKWLFGIITSEFLVLDLHCLEELVLCWGVVVPCRLLLRLLNKIWLHCATLLWNLRVDGKDLQVLSGVKIV